MVEGPAWAKALRWEWGPRWGEASQGGGPVVGALSPSSGCREPGGLGPGLEHRW